MNESPSNFQVLHRSAPCNELAGSLPDVDVRSVVITHPIDRAVVLGSMQSFSALQYQRCRQAGYDVVRRLSGGGGVVVVPGEIVWIDLFLPVHDPLYVRDVRVGSFLIGDLWTVALGSLGLEFEALSVHRGGMVKNAWSSLSCFAGTGPGEVLNGGQKIMGLSQRRTRAGAWFFTLVYRQLQPDRDAYLLVEEGQSPTELAEILRDQVAAVDLPYEQIEQAMLGALDRRT